MTIWRALLVALVSVVITNPLVADALPLTSLLEPGGKLTVGGKRFGDFAVVETSLLDVSGIDVAIVVDRARGQGIVFTGLPAVSYRDDELPAFGLTLSFSVTALSPMFLIDGIAAEIFGEADKTGSITMSSRVFDPLTGLRIAELGVGLSDSPFSTSFSAVDFAFPVSTAFVVTNLFASGGDIGTATPESYAQFVSDVSARSVPAPSLRMLFGAGAITLALGVRARRA
jgi:hypothetical protein